MPLQRRSTLNFLVPARGGTHVLSMSLPADNSPFGYAISFKSLNLVTEGELFIPQAVTIDASALAAGVSVAFTIAAINYKRVVLAGQVRTFQFPALLDLECAVTPSDGASTVPCWFFDYPALPDADGAVAGSSNVLVTQLPSAPLGQSVLWTPIAGGPIAAVGTTSLYTPASRFSLLHAGLVITNAALAVAGVLEVELLDGTAVIARWPKFLSTVASGAEAVLGNDIDVFFPNNPYLSQAAGNHLQINLTSQLQSGGIYINGFISV